jgi:type II secretory pathway pseudopilin PulG
VIRRFQAEDGTTLIETVVAAGILAVLMSGVIGLIAVSSRVTENQGHLAARTTEYAQDKMEQLLSLTYADPSSNTAVFPATNTGGTGLTAGGNSTPSTPVTGYVDWLDANGNLLTSSGTTAPSGWFYERVWVISVISTNLKQITVTATVSRAIGREIAPKSTVTSLKSSPF